MSKEERELLINDLCGRLNYGVMVRTSVSTKPLTCEILSHIINGTNNFTILPYLRPFSSMTDEEKETYNCFFDENGSMNCSVSAYVDWLLSCHFDFRGLIPRGLALEATENMYKIDLA